MIKLVSTIVANFLLVASMFYCVSKLLKTKIDFFKPKSYICYIVLSIFSILNYYFINNFIKMILITICFAIVIRFLFNTSIKTAIITSIYYEVIMIFCETIFVLQMNLFFGMNSQDIVQTQFGSFYSNLAIGTLSIILVNLKLINKLYKIINSFINKLTEYHIIVMSLIIIIIANILEGSIYYDIDFRYLLIFNTLIVIFCFCIVLYSFKTKNNYNKVYDKYNTTLNSLKEYEDILDKYKVSNHENKNQLLTIRNMMSGKNKKVINYIDEIVKNKLKDDEKIMYEVSIIPAGGLRGLIYSKVLYMKQNGIEYELNISKEIRTFDLINNLDDSDILDICQIIGVYVDNATEAVKELKEKYVSIEMYLQNNNLIFDISNYYMGEIEIDKIDQKGYTTKGEGHGYGLTLAKKIIDSNKKLSSEKKLSKTTFSQILKIKM